VQTLRRLAQNREAARKSRLRKKVSESTADDLHQDWNKKDEKKKCQRINIVSFFFKKKVDIVQILIPIIQCQRRFILFYFSLLQQAYIQQLESSRIRLAQLEQELHTARAQV